MNDFAPPAEMRRVECSLEEIAVRVKEYYVRGDQATREGVEYYRLVGEWLLKAKARLPHGRWLEWVERNALMSERKAQRCMRLAQTTPGTDLDEVWAVLCGRDGTSAANPTPVTDLTEPLDARQLLTELNGQPPSEESLKPHKPLDPMAVPFEGDGTPTAKARVAEAFDPLRTELRFLRTQLGKDTSGLKQQTDGLENEFLRAFGCKARGGTP